MHAVIVRIEHMDAAFAVAGQRPRVEQLAWLPATRSPTGDRSPVEGKLLHAMVAIFTDINVALAVERQVVRIVKLAGLSA